MKYTNIGTIRNQDLKVGDHIPGRGTVLALGEFSHQYGWAASMGNDYGTREAHPTARLEILNNDQWHGVQREVKPETIVLESSVSGDELQLKPVDGDGDVRVYLNGEGAYFSLEDLKEAVERLESERQL